MESDSIKAQVAESCKEWQCSLRTNLRTYQANWQMQCFFKHIIYKYKLKII